MLKIRLIRDVASRVAYHKTDAGLSEAERTGAWLGGGVRAAGYSAAGVSAEELAAGLSGYSAEGRYLGQRKSSKRRAGWDVVLSAGKSISVGALCLPGKTGGLVREAWDEAVRATVAAMESLACHCVSGGGTAATGNLIVATFTHERSRHNDPHLHTHCIVINATFSREAGWRGLEPAPVFRNNLQLDAVFQHELARGLALRGLPVALDGKGRASLPVPEKITWRLSKAKRVLDAAVEEGAVPDALRSVGNKDVLRNLLNDRLRPRKRPPSARTDAALTAAERSAVSRLLRAGREPPPARPVLAVELARAVVSAYHRIALWPSTKKLFRAMVETARKMPMLSFQALLRSLPLVPHPQPGAAPPTREVARLRARRKAWRTVLAGRRPLAGRRAYHGGRLSHAHVVQNLGPAV
jgi:conjugative relaxase-like TrwC/TraI family protein